MENQNPKQDLTTKELAEKAGCDPSYIRQSLLAGRLKGYKRGRDWLIPVLETEHWLQERRQKA